ncbi:putative MFS family arabinose efflux permease [Variovorax boronicumulans]|uniref:MFS family arabinose efflux permease n=1 Tax=Variovorax boronicumulans TaxID=436515 RepID=A0AAW8DSM0_9BURK|nr:putative MFS family arabinose efflux permease [Variovorax boronicumulans]MDP9922556.1 putative MFS family arabinose efflux permease [Variovorax boronicumulans]
MAQTLSWASSYYLPAVLAGAISKDIGVSTSTVFGAFSVALLVAAGIGPVAGRLIDRLGGRPVLIVSNVVFAAGLAALSQATHANHVFAAWALMGLAMGSGLYEAAFATVVRLYGQDARRSITGVTLFAGFASTVGWPLSAYLENAVGWRGACLAWAALHLVIGLPLNVLLPRAPRADQASKEATGAERGTGAGLAPAQQRRAAVLMAYVFAVTWFISTAMAAHLPELLLASGATLAVAVGIAALVGPAQVAGRVIEFTFLKRAHPLFSARLATLAHPLGALGLGLVGTSAAAAFAVLHGLGNGILTIAIGTLPLLIFGAKGYGQRQGFLMVPARIVQAGAPFLFGLAVERWGDSALWFSALLGLSACLALVVMTADMSKVSRAAEVH